MARRTTLGELDARSLDNIATSVAYTSNPVLFRTDGSVIGLANHSELQSIRLRNHDLLVVGPHGEIVPFPTKAMNQGLLPQTGNTMIQIDAHPDATPTATSQQEGMLYLYESAKIAELIQECLERPKNTALFQYLVSETNGDIQTFIHALQAHCNQIVACVRGETKRVEQSVVYGPMPTTKYIFLRDGTTPEASIKTLRQLIAECTGPRIYSIDGDFAGVMDEHYKYTHDTNGRPQLIPKPNGIPIDGMQKIFNRAMRYLISALQPEIDRAAEPTTRLYTISLDHKFCIQPKKFLRAFIKGFYLKLIQKLNPAAKLTKTPLEANQPSLHASSSSSQLFASLKAYPF